MPRPTRLPDHLLDAPFTVRDANEAGVSYERLRRGDLRVPRRGTRTTEPEPDTTGMTPWDAARIRHLDAATHEALCAREPERFSHVTAALALDMPLRLHRFRKAPLDISVREGNARRRRVGLRAHPTLDTHPPVEASGLTVTSPISTWCDLAAALTVDELVEIGDWLVRRQDPIATVAELEETVAARGRRHGIGRLREALSLVRARTDSVRETELRLIIVRAGLPEPEVNISVRDDLGLHVKWGDLVYETERVLVEYDGDQHRTDDRQYAKDADDAERLARSGWLIIHVRKAHLRSPSSIAARIRSAFDTQRALWSANPALGTTCVGR
jgi:hypothetical protein